MTTPDNTTRLELAITELRGSMDAGMARIEGSLALLVQRAEHTDQRAEGHAREISKHDDRLDVVERTMVTRAELDERDARLRLEAEQRAAEAERRETQARAQADEQARRKQWGIGALITVLAVLLSSGIAVLGIIIK